MATFTLYHHFKAKATFRSKHFIQGQQRTYYSNILTKEYHTTAICEPKLHIHW